MPQPATALAVSEIDFRSLIRDHDRRLRGLAFRMLGDRDRMDDVLQEAYTNAYRARDRFAGGADAGTWLYRIVYNACIDDIRRRGRRPVSAIGDRDIAVPEASAEDRFADRSRLAVAFDALSEEQKAVVWLVDVEGFDYGAAAGVLGIAPGTVGSRLSRAHALLRDHLGEED